MRPRTERNEPFVCPACGADCISLNDRGKLSLLNSIDCPACGAGIRLKWGRAFLSIYLCVVTAFAVSIFIRWPVDAHLMEALLGPFILAQFVFVVTARQRLPLTSG